MTTTLWHNPAAREWTSEVAAMDCRAFHASLPGYAPTPLPAVPDLATRLGLKTLHVKDESARFGLPAFKMLGASWGGYRALCAWLGARPPWRDIAEFGAAVRSAGTPRLVTASAGNHGRALARLARWLELPAVVLLPATTSQRLADAISGEGADVRRVDGSYDDAVRAAIELAVDPDHLLVQDTAWPGYTEVPRWIEQGYQTMLHEIDEQLAGAADWIVVPVGVGSLLGTVLAHARIPGRATRVLAVEPDAAACLRASLSAGAPVTVPTGKTIMEGMNAGTVSAAGWPSFRDGLDAAITVSDDAARAAGDSLRQAGVELGPCGWATLAGLSASGLGSGDTVVLLGTDGSVG